MSAFRLAPLDARASTPSQRLGLEVAREDILDRAQSCRHALTYGHGENGYDLAREASRLHPALSNRRRAARRIGAPTPRRRLGLVDLFRRWAARATDRWPRLRCDRCRGCSARRRRVRTCCGVGTSCARHAGAHRSLCVGSAEVRHPRKAPTETAMRRDTSLIAALQAAVSAVVPYSHTAMVRTSGNFPLTCG